MRNNKYLIGWLAGLSVMALSLLGACYPMFQPTRVRIVSPTPPAQPSTQVSLDETVTPIIARPLPTNTRLPIISPSAVVAPQRTATIALVTTISRTPTRSGMPEWATRTLLIAPGQPGRMYALLTDQPFSTPGAERMRFVVSDDFGKTWGAFDGGLPSEPSCINDINLDYAARDALYASTCHGLYRWSSNQWTLISQQETYRVAIVYGQPQRMWAITHPEQGPIVKSSDGGIHWQGASQDLSYFPNGVANLAIDPRDDNALYAIISPKYGGSYLRRGTSNGQWITIPTPMNDSQIDTGMTMDGATGDLYITAFNSRAGHWGVWRSHNPNAADANRIQWELVYEYGDKLWATMLASGWSPQGLALYARLRDYDSSRSSVGRSLDGGRTWNVLMIR